jgi:hypothetical protein
MCAKMNTTIKLKNPPEETKLRMEDDPRFLTLLAGLGGSCLSQFEIYRKSRQRDYDGEFEIENLTEDEEWRLEILTDRVWFAAVRLYKSREPHRMETKGRMDQTEATE